MIRFSSSPFQDFYLLVQRLNQGIPVIVASVAIIPGLGFPFQDFIRSITIISGAGIPLLIAALDFPGAFLGCSASLLTEVAPGVPPGYQFMKMLIPPVMVMVIGITCLVPCCFSIVSVSVIDDR